MRIIGSIFLLFFLWLNATVHAQTVYNRWSADLSLGFNSAIGPFADGYSSNFLTFVHLDAGARYMLTNKFGVKWDFGFDRIKDDESGHIQLSENNYLSESLPFETHYFRTSLQLVFDAGRILEFENIYEDLSFLVHAGFGFSSLKDTKNSVWFKSWKNQGTDEMMNWIVGITPQYKFSDRISVNMDLSMVYNAWQSKTFDFTENNFEKGLHAKIFNFSAGITYYIGKNQKHLDWVVLPSGRSTYIGSDTVHRIETIRTIETIRVRGQEIESQEEETKGDGGLGLGNNNKEYKLKGVEPTDDFDKDGVLNDNDVCPNLAGTLPNGCPETDQDGDGVLNEVDDCPDIFGLVESKGCPILDFPTKVILNDAMNHVKFEPGTTNMIDSSDQYIIAVVGVMTAHPEYRMEIQGHTDNMGDPTPLMALSQQRSEAVRDFMVTNGIDASRLYVKGFGDTMPLASNEHPAGRAQNDRIVFKVVFY